MPRRENRILALAKLYLLDPSDVQVTVLPSGCIACRWSRTVYQRQANESWSQFA